MMERKKAFVVGAGASAEFNLPTGQKLVEKIEDICRIESDHFGNLISGDIAMRRVLGSLERQDGSRWNPAFLAEVAGKIRKNMGLAPSIDNFLDTKQAEEGFAEVGKIAIARAILRAEARSPLYFDTSNFYNAPNFAQFPRNWLTELFRILVIRKGRQEFVAALDSCYFVTFNYDRTIEQFFHQAIRSYFDLEPPEVEEICAQYLHVFHVYGSLGELTGTNPVKFGEWEGPANIKNAAAQIRTFTEGVLDSTGIQFARHWISEADVLCFLGFGFLDLNLTALAPSEGLEYNHEKVIGTAKGVPENNLAQAWNFISHNWYGGERKTIPTEDVFANELIWRHSAFLSEAYSISHKAK